MTTDTTRAMRLFRAAARKIEAAIASYAATGGDIKRVGNQARPLFDAINTLEGRTAKPEIRGDEVARTEAWDTCSRLRQQAREADEKAFAIRQSRRSALSDMMAASRNVVKISDEEQAYIRDVRASLTRRAS